MIKAMLKTIKIKYMNRTCFSKTNLHESASWRTSCIRPVKNKMKTNLLLLSLIFLPSLAMAQSQVDKLFDKYSGKDGFTTVYITQYMFDMFKDVNTSDKDFNDLIKNLKSIRILAVEDAKAIPAGTNFYKEIMQSLTLNQYKELMVIKNKDQDIKFLMKENQGKIAELLMISGGKENVFICIEGNIDMKSLAKLSKSLNIEGIKPLQNFNGKGGINTEPHK